MQSVLETTPHMKNKPLIIGNWKMKLGHKASKDLASSILKAAKKANLAKSYDMVLCPSSTSTAAVAKILKESSIAVGGQDCHWEKEGAHTGDVSADMLKEAGASYVINGHSARRMEHFETSDIVRDKADAAHRAELISVICVGEPINIREKGDDEAEKFVLKQLKKSLPEKSQPSNTVIAYEPVWAIGTGRTPTSEQIAKMHGVISKYLGGEYRVLYGGSLTPSNAKKILALDGVAGGLIGGASLDADDFCQIAACAEDVGKAA